MEVGFPKSMDISKNLDKRNGRNPNIKFKNYLNEKRKEKGYSLADINKLMNVATNGGGFASGIMGEKDNIILPTKENYNKLKKILDLDDRYDELINTTEAEREVIGKKEYTADKNVMNIRNYTGERVELDITIPSTDLAKQWQGWGTALKPSFEPIIIARKPFKGSLVDNVIKWGVGGLNIDECRVGTNEQIEKGRNGRNNKSTFQASETNVNQREYQNSGRFPANTILTYDQITFDEVCGGFPNTKPAGNKKESNITVGNSIFGIGGIGKRNPKIPGDNGGSASRYFMNCKYTGKDEEIWKQLLVNNVGNNLEILKATKDNIVQMNVEDLLKELKDHYAKYVDNQLDLIETPIVQDIVKMLTWDFKIETSQVIQDFIINSKKCIQFLNLVQFVEKMDNIDTTQTTQNLLKLFGYVKVVITNYIQGNIEYAQKRYIYTPKASKKDRDEGLEEFETAKVNDGRKKDADNAFQRGATLRHNIHPTVKPTELMQYLVRLVSPKGATILDPFMGSGSTGKAVAYENKERQANYNFIGIELNKEYCDIAEARIKFVEESE